MNEKVFQRKTWMIYLVLLMVLLKPITAHAAEDREAYRAVFDADYYYNQYPDLQTTIGYDPEKLFSHFVTAGAREGRSGNAEFNLRAYVFYNHDLLDACKTDLSAYCRHYTTVGKTEGRISLPRDDERGVIGTYSTSYDVTLPRAVNIGLAIQRIHGTVLQPGEAFSFSSAVLPRNAKNGYVLAPAIGGNEYGGGICQVSSTLYAAMCHALLPATERYPHSSRVSYLPVGLDATISEGRKDLKFVNIYQEPLTILAVSENGVLTVSLCLGDEVESAEQADTEQADAGQTSAEQIDAVQTDAEQTDAVQTDAGQADTVQDGTQTSQTVTVNAGEPAEQEERGPAFENPQETQEAA